MLPWVLWPIIANDWIWEGGHRNLWFIAGWSEVQWQPGTMNWHLRWKGQSCGTELLTCLHKLLLVSRLNGIVGHPADDAENFFGVRKKPTHPRSAVSVVVVWEWKRDIRVFSPDIWDGPPLPRSSLGQAWAKPGSRKPLGYTFQETLAQRGIMRFPWTFPAGLKAASHLLDKHWDPGEGLSKLQVVIHGQ